MGWKSITLKQVPRFEQSSRGKQINPSSPPLIKADAPSVREREVAGSAAPSEPRQFFIALALGSAQTKCSTIFLCPRGRSRPAL